MQSIIVKYKLMDAPDRRHSTRAAAADRRGLRLRFKAAPGDPYKVTFGTNNEYLLPLVAKLGFKADDLTSRSRPWRSTSSCSGSTRSRRYKDAKAFIAAAKASPMRAEDRRQSQSKDTDQTLTSMITAATGAKFIYVPFKSGGEAAVQLAGGHIDSNVNNPNENIGQWKAGDGARRCASSAPSGWPRARRSPRTWAGPTSRPARKPASPSSSYQMPRTVWLPAGVPADAVAFYAGVLAKVRQTPEWKTTSSARRRPTASWPATD